MDALNLFGNWGYKPGGAIVRLGGVFQLLRYITPFGYH